MSEEISIFVRSMDEKKESILIKPSDSIKRLKELVHDKFSDVDLAEILLLFRGRILNDDQTISSCNIASEDTILLVVRQRSEPEQPTQPPQNPTIAFDDRFRHIFDGAFTNARVSFRHLQHSSEGLQRALSAPVPEDALRLDPEWMRWVRRALTEYKRLSERINENSISALQALDSTGNAPLSVRQFESLVNCMCDQNRISSLISSSLNHSMHQINISQREQRYGNSQRTQSNHGSDLHPVIPSSALRSQSGSGSSPSLVTSHSPNNGSENQSGSSTPDRPSSIEFVISLSATPQDDNTSREEIWRDLQGIVGTLMQTLSGRGNRGQTNGQTASSESPASTAPTDSAQQSGPASTPSDSTQQSSSNSSSQTSSGSQLPSSNPSNLSQSNSTQSQNLDSILESTLNSTLNPSVKRDTPANLPNPKRSK